MMSMRHYACLVLLWVLTWLPRATSAFQCGNDICERRGHVACLGSGEDAYCLLCTDKRAKCGTAAQLPGCYRFCQELVRNQTIHEFELIQKKLNDSFKGQIKSNEEDVAQTLSTYHVIVIVVGLLVACLLLVILALICLNPKCRQKYQRCQTEDCDKTLMDDLIKAEEGGIQDNKEETSRFFVDDQPQRQASTHSVNHSDVKPATQSQGCQTDPQVTASKEAATETDCNLPDTGSACTDTHNQTGDRPDRSSPPLNNIPPTEDNGDVVLGLNKLEHPGVRSTQPSNGVVADAQERQRYPL